MHLDFLLPTRTTGAKSEVLRAAKIQIQVFCSVTTCSVVVGYLAASISRLMAARSSETLVSYRKTTVSQLRTPRENGGSMDLRNVGILPQHYTASQPRRLYTEQQSLLTFTHFS
jgi:hypothetical protein